MRARVYLARVRKVHCARHSRGGLGRGRVEAELAEGSSRRFTPVDNARYRRVLTLPLLRRSESGRNARLIMTEDAIWILGCETRVSALQHF